MTETVTISGASDDLIEIGGAIREELYANYDEPTTVHIGPWSFEVVYNDRGEWEILLKNVPAGASCTKWGVGGHPEYRDYTQVVEIDIEEDWEVRSE